MKARSTKFNLVTTALAFVVLTLCGCGRDIHVRDVQSYPVSQADISVTYYSVTYDNKIKTDGNGYCAIPKPAFLTIESVTVSKPGYQTVILRRPQKPYIAVLVPEEIKLPLKKEAAFLP
jgi:hypothetical protein